MGGRGLNGFDVNMDGGVRTHHFRGAFDGSREAEFVVDEVVEEGH